MKRLWKLAAVAGAVGGLALASTIPAGAAHLFYSQALLTGASEVPGPGDPDGAGRIMVETNVTDDTVCIAVQMRAVAKATGAHIHLGSRTEAGPVVVSLPLPKGGRLVEGCVDVADALADAIAADPSAYYVNVHNDEYPAGAIRGQLRATPAP